MVEGRQRVEQRLAQLAAQVVEWNTRQQDASAELEQLEGQDMDAQEQAAILEAQLEEHAMREPELHEALQQAQARAASQRAVVVQVQHIQVLAAEQRSLDEQSRQQQARSERVRPIAKPWWCPIRSSWPSCSSNSTRPAKPPNWPRRLCKELQDSVPQPTKRAANASSRSTMKARAKPSWPRAAKYARCKKK